MRTYIQIILNFAAYKSASVERNDLHINGQPEFWADGSIRKMRAPRSCFSNRVYQNDFCANL